MNNSGYVLLHYKFLEFTSIQNVIFVTCVLKQVGMVVSLVNCLLAGIQISINDTFFCDISSEIQTYDGAMSTENKLYNQNSKT